MAGRLLLLLLLLASFTSTQLVRMGIAEIDGWRGETAKKGRLFGPCMYNKSLALLASRPCPALFLMRAALARPAQHDASQSPRPYHLSFRC